MVSLKSRHALAADSLLWLVLAFLVLFMPAQLNGQSANYQMKAQLWTYGTLCEFFPHSGKGPLTLTLEGEASRTDSSVTQAIVAVDTKSMTACSDLEKTLGHLPAVRVTVVNTADSDLTITLDGLNSVHIKSKNGKIIPALAWLYRKEHVKIPSEEIKGSRIRFNGVVAELKGHVTTRIEPAESADFFVLFPAAGFGDSIKVGEFEYVRIGAD